MIVSTDLFTYLFDRHETPDRRSLNGREALRRLAAEAWPASVGVDAGARCNDQAPDPSTTNPRLAVADDRVNAGRSSRLGSRDRRAKRRLAYAVERRVAADGRRRWRAPGRDRGARVVIERRPQLNAVLYVRRIRRALTG